MKTVTLTRLLGDGCQARQGLDTDVTLPHTWLNVLHLSKDVLSAKPSCLFLDAHKN